MTQIQNAIEFRNITKEFPGIKANDNVSFNIQKGTIHALIGENGAGKSTLMSILFGLYEPTSGEILVNDKKVFFKSPNDAANYGIGMVHQHFKLVKVYSNLNNIVLGSEWTKNHFIDNKTAELKIKALQDAYNLHFDLKQKSGNATVSTQQKVEIMKMLYRDNDILVFDEPTAVLTDEEIQGLLKSFLKFKEAGKTIIFISHKLNEIEQVADYATVLRHGKSIGTYDVKKTPMSQIVEAMVGTNVVATKNTASCERKDVVLELRNISTKKLQKNLNNLSLKIHKGEILAIAGVEGNGQREIEQIVSGMATPSEGTIFLRKSGAQLAFEKAKLEKLQSKNPSKAQKYLTSLEHKSQSKNYDAQIFHDITKFSVKKRSKQNISYIPTDRHAHGLVLDYTIRENSVLRRLWDNKFVKLSIFRNKNINAHTKSIIEKYDVRGSLNGNATSRSLSGGNQQKFIVGREIEAPHDLIIVMQPTRGLDVKAINTIHDEILKEKREGKAILLISYELDEVLALADTIAVLNEGQIVALKDARQITRQEIGSYMANKKGGENGQN
ncbi:ABC transporter ATP-binding protein [Mycoplasmopsis columbina]|uniref:ABC transporter ATP-binding protein n=1 Tax=Mycoplasmopsis columbina TaxID=114881 RepID=UPI0004A72709|nr:ABC transporter ATP-binding protein [Mycoplasmopsis columbina]VEU77115.1 simple sugar ABC transporter ATP-binding protein,P59-like protein [Mycoplasmopsis columbina]